MFHTLYETLNCKNGKHYIGVHSTENPYDDYLGSGRSLLKAIRKEGRQNFEKFILGIFPTRESALDAEAEIVNAAFVNNPQTYNRAVGGDGGMVTISDAHKKAISKANKGKPSPMLGRKHSLETRSAMSKKRKGVPLKPGWKHTEEAKKAISEKRKGNQHAKGAKHSAEANAQKSIRMKEIWAKRRAGVQH